MERVRVEGAGGIRYLLKFLSLSGDLLEELPFDTMRIALDQAADIVGLMPDAWRDPGRGKPVLVLDGSTVNSLADFYDEASRVLMSDVDWKTSNLDGFNDVLRGGFGAPSGGFVLRWEESDRCRQTLGWPETVRYLEQKLTSCHSSNLDLVEADLMAARREEGETLFEILFGIITAHGPGGREGRDGVDLVLA